MRDGTLNLNKTNSKSSTCYIVAFNESVSEDPEIQYS